MHAGIRESDLCRAHAVGTAQQPDQYLFNHQRREQFGISRMRDELDEPYGRVEDLRICLIEIDCTGIRDTGQSKWRYLRYQLRDEMWIQIESKTEKRLGSSVPRENVRWFVVFTGEYRGGPFAQTSEPLA